MKNALRFSHQCLETLLRTDPNGNYIDATVGNGHDIDMILSSTHFDGHVWGFDIQSQAINQTKNKIQHHHPDRYTLIHDSHAHLDRYLPDNALISGAIFNLGYLPGGDPSITTLFDSTQQAIDAILPRLASRGQIILVVYSGHSAGKVESDQLLEYARSLPQTEVDVLCYQFINQQNNPPYTLVIERK